ncbi:hypothetical protein M5K25_001871 [Dendrobium thyrsiflorum]|uniref:Exosome complex component CSL4 C-terminal domain-containing protein n=1 Tax=Dendrobium thyrsiflorum TaxID=117978 RepID=A0ABD0W4I1_DENTH
MSELGLLGSIEGSAAAQQDVRATEIDKVDMYQSFRPGDIVKAEVLSLGDARAYYLSTAKNELGVVSAQSIAECQVAYLITESGFLLRI